MTEKFSQEKETKKVILSVQCRSARHYTKCEVIMDAAQKTGLQLNTDQCEVIMDGSIQTSVRLSWTQR